MNLLDIAGALLLAVGALFFLAGTVGLLRFPDVYTRLHALTKVDNLGLGCVVVALMLRADSIAAVFKLGLIWMLALLATATAGYLIANSARSNGVELWRSESEDDA
jgi:multicomponent Na+:H+ antiporter subunit G